MGTARIIVISEAISSSIEYQCAELFFVCVPFWSGYVHGIRVKLFSESVS